MIEPTETESPETVAAIALALLEIAQESPEMVAEMCIRDRIYTLR